VLVEGSSVSYPPNAAEIYNPVTHSFTNIPSTLTAAAYRSAFRLANGRVILAGGSQNNGFNAIASAEYYDPALNQFVALPDMPH